VTLSLFGQSTEIQAAIDRLPNRVDVTVKEIGGLDATAATVETHLTERQREAVAAAVDLGYYEIPREATHEDVAAAIDCAPSTAAEHLRKAESTLVSAVVGREDSGGDGYADRPDTPRRRHRHVRRRRPDTTSCRLVRLVSRSFSAPMSVSEADRCKYGAETGLMDDTVPIETCERSTWEDHDRCVWHAQVDGKTKETLETTDPEEQSAIDGAYLVEASLANVDWFGDTSLVEANLTGADLKGANFSGANLTLATLTDVSAIATDFSGANLEGAILTNADLRRATIEDARLHETVLRDMHIGGGTEMGDVSIYDREQAPPDLIEKQPLDAAAWVYRQLQFLYEDNALPRLARRSYHRERDARRRLAWRESDYATAVKWELSRWTMKYGSSPYRVLLTSLVVVVVFALLFPLTGGIQETQAGSTITYSIDDPENAPRWWLAMVLFKSLYFSVVTFATLGLGDIQPIGTTARFLAGAESVIGSLLAALLVFVLARIVTW
jgi:hypothetical protein